LRYSTTKEPALFIIWYVWSIVFVIGWCRGASFYIVIFFLDCGCLAVAFCVSICGELCGFVDLI
jgi:hypothetical protein